VPRSQQASVWIVDSPELDVRQEPVAAALRNSGASYLSQSPDPARFGHAACITQAAPQLPAYISDENYS